MKVQRPLSASSQVLQAKRSTEGQQSSPMIDFSILFRLLLHSTTDAEFPPRRHANESYLWVLRVHHGNTPWSFTCLSHILAPPMRASGFRLSRLEALGFAGVCCGAVNMPTRLSNHEIPWPKSALSRGYCESIHTRTGSRNPLN